MRRSPIRALAVVGLVTAACNSPTADCGCLPPLRAVVVTGRVVDASDAPVANARVAADGVPRTMSYDGPIQVYRLAATTGANGEFVVRAYSAFDADTLALRAMLVRPGTADTVKVRLGDARFPDERGPLDTVHVTVQLP